MGPEAVAREKKKKEKLKELYFIDGAQFLEFLKCQLSFGGIQSKGNIL